MSLKILVSVAALAVSMGVAGCSTSDGATSQPAEASSSKPSTAEKQVSDDASEAQQAAEPVAIGIKDFEFRGPATVAPGATVQVQNDDRSTHSFTSENGAFAEVILEGGGATGMFTAPSEPGEYRYVCKFHPEMVATLVVA